MSLIVVALCIVGINTGNFSCLDTSFAAPSVLDCTDQPTNIPFGGSDRGSGWLAAGNMIDGQFVPKFSFTYDWSGWQVISGNIVRGVYGVDEDLIFRDGIRHCQFIEDVN